MKTNFGLQNQKASGLTRAALRSGMLFALALVLLSAAFSVGAGAQAPNPPGQQKIGPEVRAALQNEGQARVVIMLRDTFAMQRARADLPTLKNEVARSQAQVLSTLDRGEYRGKNQYQTVPALAGTILSERALAKLAANPNVVKIDLDVGGTGTLGTSIPQIGADQRHARGNTGAGVVVAVLDSGMDTDHDDLVDDLIWEECFLDDDGTIDGNGRCPNGSDRQTGAGAAEDDHGHGTHVNGIITSNGTQSSVGVAPDADIVAVKVLDSNNAFFFFSEIVAALDFIINNRPDVNLINMSLGTNALYNGDCDNSNAGNMAGAAAINTLRANGVVAFAASGNDSSGTQMSSPACLSNVISVGATDNNDNVAGFTNSNASTDIMAPGVSIVSDAIGGGTTTLSGTSMASPTAAGCAALLIESGEATTPNQIETRLETSSIQVTDATNGLTFPRIDCSPLNVPPTVDAGGPYTGDEGVAIALDQATANDLDGDSLTFAWTVDSALCSFSDASLLNPTVTCGDDGNFTVTLTVSDGENDPVSDTAAVTVANAPPQATADPATQSVQYSDYISDVTITATDVAQDPLTASTSWSVDGGPVVAGLPDGLSLASTGCTVSSGTNTCGWTLSGTADDVPGVVTVLILVADDAGAADVEPITITVTPEDASVAFDENNPVAVEVDAPGGDSGPFSLTLFVTETEPDLPAGSSAPGDISKAVVSISLVPVGPGGSVAGTCLPDGVSGTGYDAQLSVTCSFDNVPVNTYLVTVDVGGGYYVGSGEDVLVVYDPSLGFTTGGGWFTWPGTGERTNFGYNMKYNKAHKNVQGSLLLIRHLADGSIYRLKSNRLYGLAIGEGSGFGWASFSGKATYLEPGWEEAIGNHQFIVYVEDHGTPGAGMDAFWIEVQDKDGNIVALSLDRDAVDHTETLGGGNIVVPHTTGKPD